MRENNTYQQKLKRNLCDVTKTDIGYVMMSSLGILIYRKLLLNNCKQHKHKSLIIDIQQGTGITSSSVPV